MPMSPRIPPCPDSAERVPGPNYQIPSPPPMKAKDATKPLMVLRVRPGIEINEARRDRLMVMSEQIGKALISGGGLILDDSVVEPLVLIYEGQVIRFDGYEEDVETQTPPAEAPRFRPERRSAADRETW